MGTETTILALPSDLLEAVDKMVEEGRARSRNELVESALRHELADLRRRTVDAEFEHMASDADYRNEVHQLFAEFGQSDLETPHDDVRQA